jgi:uncharacterized protein with FMN-binding domain
MRRPAAVVLGTVTGAVLMTAARLGTPASSGAETVAEAPLDRAIAGPANPGPSADPGKTSPPGASAEPQRGATRTVSPPADGTTTTTAPPPGATLNDGTFAGSAVTHKYGTLQVSIVVSGGTVSDVKWVYTTSSPLSQKINADALPTLRSETLKVQSAQVHTVSGATYTSNAFRTSVQSAIERAS